MRPILALLVVAAALTAPAASARDAWYSTADARCATATREARQLVATIVTVRTEAEMMRFLRNGVAIQARLAARLQGAGPPDANARRFVALLVRSVDLDRRSVAQLERGVSRDAIQDWIDEGGRMERSALRLARTIGLRGCARYLNPETYK